MKSIIEYFYSICEHCKLKHGECKYFGAIHECLVMLNEWLKYDLSILDDTLGFRK